MASMLPNLIIVGVHKSATTSLFMYLSAHPQIYGSSKKEIHYFTPLRYGHFLISLNQYKDYFKDRKNEKYALEASPSYFYGKGTIIHAMKKTLGEHKAILMLREPTARFISFYKHLKSKLLIDEKESLERFIEKSMAFIDKPIEEKNPYSRAIQEGFYINYIEPWLDNYKNNLKIVYFEDLKNTRDSMMSLCDWLEINKNFYDSMNFEIENKTVFANNKLIHKAALWTNEKLETVLRKNPVIKNSIRKIYFSINKSKAEETIDSIMINTLHEIYRKPNYQLQQLFESRDMRVPQWLKQ